MPKITNCESCRNKGWLLAESGGELEIQRCDACCRFLTDTGAVEYVAKEFEKLSQLRDVCKDILNNAIPSGCSEIKHTQSGSFFLGTFTVNGNRLEQINNILNIKEQEQSKSSPPKITLWDEKGE